VRNRRPLALTSLVVGLALLAGACGNQTSGGTSSGGTPQQGGTLNLVGSSDVDHLDTASAYYVASYTLERAFTSQLISYRPPRTSPRPTPPWPTSPPRSRPGPIHRRRQPAGRPRLRPARPTRAARPDMDRIVIERRRTGIEPA